MYDSLLSLTYRNGMPRVINGSDAIRLLLRYRGVTEVYEPDVWRYLIQGVQPGDVVADVGAMSVCTPSRWASGFGLVAK
jgi:hypothetical protein